MKKIIVKFHAKKKMKNDDRNEKDFMNWPILFDVKYNLRQIHNTQQQQQQIEFIGSTT